MYDHRELKLYFPRAVAERIKREAAEQGISEQRFVQNCVLEKLEIEVHEQSEPKLRVA